MSPGNVNDVHEERLFAGPDAAPDAPPSLLIEIPHGATTAEHYLAARRRMRGDLPADLEQFFFVNTDAGAPECAERIARLLTAPDDALSSMLPSAQNATDSRRSPWPDCQLSSAPSGRRHSRTVPSSQPAASM